MIEYIVLFFIFKSILYFLESIFSIINLPSNSKLCINIIVSFDFKIISLITFSHIFSNSSIYTEYILLFKLYDMQYGIIFSLSTYVSISKEFTIFLIYNV